MTISLVGSNTAATTTLTPPTHSVGDLIIMVAGRAANATAPTLATGYTSINTKIGGATTAAIATRTGWKTATATNDAGGTWTNATQLGCLVYTSDQIAGGGAVSVGASASGNNNSTTCSMPTVTLQTTTGTSWVATAALSNNATTITGSSTGLTSRAHTTSGTGRLALFDTNAGVSSFAAHTVTVGTGNWVGWSIEVKETLAPTSGITQFNSNTVLSTTSTVVVPLAIKAGDYIACYGWWATSSQSLSTLATSAGDNAVIQPINGSTTPLSLTLNSFGVTSFLGLIKATAAATSVTATLSASSGDMEMGCWVIRGATNLVLDKSIEAGTVGGSIAKSGLTGTLAYANEYALAYNITGLATNSLDLSQTGSAGFVQEGAGTTSAGNFFARQVTASTSSIQAAFDTSGGADSASHLATFYDNGPTKVQFATNDAFSGTTASVTLPGTAAGNFILVAAIVTPVSGTATVTSISDGTNSYTLKSPTTSGNGQHVMGYLFNVAGGSTTITATSSASVTGGGALTIWAEEWSPGLSNIATFDTSNAASVSGTNVANESFNPGSITTTANNDFIWVWGNCAQGGELNPGSGFVIATDDTTNSSWSSEVQIKSSAGSITPSMSSVPGGFNYSTGVMAFRTPSTGTNVNATGVQANTAAGTVSITASANSAATGVQATASAGSVTTTATKSANVAVTGVQATSAAGTLTITASGNASVTGVQASTAVGTVTMRGDASKSITGVQGTTAAGTVTITGSASPSVTGVQATTAAGTVSITGSASKNITGVQATSAAGTVTITGSASKSITGVQATTAAGTLSETASANVVVTGVQATTAAGSVSITIGTNVSLTGVQATTAAGTLTDTASANVSITGVQASAAAGTVTLTASGNASVTGVQATTAAGSVALSLSKPLTGVQATTAAGTLSETASANATVTGVQAAAAAGTLTMRGDVSSIATGVQANTAAGIVSLTGSANATVTGAQATTAAGTVAASVYKTITGVQASTAAGTVSTTSSANVLITGVQSVASAGAVSFAGQTNITPTGVQATTAAGTVSFIATASPLISGVQANTAAGSAVPSPARQVTGVQANTAAGTVSLSIAKPLGGVQATAAAGSVSEQSSPSPHLTGVQGTSAAGSVSFAISTNATVTGVQATTGTGTAGPSGDNSVNITGVHATASAGTATVSSSASKSVVGVSATTQAGSVTITASGSSNLSGVAGTSAAGTLSVSTTRNDNVATLGVQANTAAGIIRDMIQTALAGVQVSAAAGDMAEYDISSSERPVGASASAIAGLLAVNIRHMDGAQANSYAGSLVAGLVSYAIKQIVHDISTTSVITHHTKPSSEVNFASTRAKVSTLALRQVAQGVQLDRTDSDVN